MLRSVLVPIGVEVLTLARIGPAKQHTSGYQFGSPIGRRLAVASAARSGLQDRAYVLVSNPSSRLLATVTGLLDIGDLFGNGW